MQERSGDVQADMVLYFRDLNFLALTKNSETLIRN